MSFQFAYSLGGSDAPVTLDYGITSAVPAIGDAFIVANGIATTKLVNTTANTAKVAVSMGSNFKGLAQGGTYDATTSSIYSPATLTKLVQDPNAVYKVPWSSSATAAVIGTGYGVANSATTADQTLDVTKTTGTVLFTLVASDTVNVTSYAPYGWAYVTIPSGNRVIQG